MTTSQVAGAAAPPAPQAASEGPETSGRPPGPRPAPDPPEGGRRRWRTRRRAPWPQPVRLRAQAAGALTVLAALCVVTVAASLDLRGSLRELTEVARHRATAASELHFVLADLDAQRANTLVPGHAAGNRGLQVGNRTLALITAQERRAEASGLLAELAADPGTRDRLRAVLDHLARYDALTGKTEYADDREADRQAGHPPRLAVAFSGQAGEVMEEDLLPAVDTLARHYTQRARGTADRTGDAARRAAVATAVLGVLTVGVLLWWQRDLARRHRRLVNPALLAATLAAAAVAGAGTLSFLTVSTEVRAASDGGLRPWSRTAEARAVAAETRALQSRWVAAEPGDAVLLRDRFTALSGRLARPADGRALTGSAAGGGTDAPAGPYTERLDRAVEAWNGGTRDALTGLLLPEPGADTSTGSGSGSGSEHDAARAELLDRYAVVHRDDQRLRDLVAAGRLDQAAVLLTEVPRGHLAFDYHDFSLHLDALAADQAASATDRLAAARTALVGWPAAPGTALAAGLALVLIGVRPRLAEYRRGVPVKYRWRVPASYT